MAFYGKLALLAFGAAVAVSSTAGAQSNDWANRITLNGDARFRVERDMTYNNPNTSDNVYGRMRFRLGINAKVNDALTATARVATGASQYSTQFNLGQSPAGQGTGWGSRQSFTLDVE